MEQIDECRWRPLPWMLGASLVDAVAAAAEAAAVAGGGEGEKMDSANLSGCGWLPLEASVSI